MLTSSGPAHLYTVDVDTTPSQFSALIVDDTPDIVWRLTEALLEDGRISTVDSADNGSDALEMIRVRLPDIAFIDLNLPDLSGIQVLKGIRHFEQELSSESQEIQIFIIVLSLEPSPTTIEACKKAGANHVVSKREGVHRLISLLDELEAHE